LARPREDIKVLFERIGYNYKVGKFNAMYNRAKEIMPQDAANSDLVSVRVFMLAVKELHNVE
jgi:hypothetical protein